MTAIVTVAIVTDLLFKKCFTILEKLLVLKYFKVHFYVVRSRALQLGAQRKYRIIFDTE